MPTHEIRDPWRAWLLSLFLALSLHACSARGATVPSVDYTSASSGSDSEAYVAPPLPDLNLAQSGGDEMQMQRVRAVAPQSHLMSASRPRAPSVEIDAATMRAPSAAPSPEP